MTKISNKLAFVRNLVADRRGNALMIMGFAAVPLALSTGMAIDYSRAARLQTKLNAAADAAALAAVTQPMMKKDNAAAATAARNMFAVQVADLPGLVYDPANLTVTISGTVGASNVRTAVVSYRAKSQNAFANIVGFQMIDIAGSSTADAAAAPDIDFYMILDTSPSMLLAATSAGLASLQSATGGCAFACHQTNVTYSSGKNNQQNGWIPDNTELVCNNNKKSCKDYYQVARENDVVLRTDLLQEAVEDLTTVATQTATDNGAKYRMGLFSFDYVYRQLWPTNTQVGSNVDNDLGRVKQHVQDAEPLVYCINNYRVCGVNDDDTATSTTAAFTGALASMPVNPGDGSNRAGDTPQAIMFLITDGMRDEANNGRKLGPFPTAQCTTIKNRGIRIAVLYTEYIPEAATGSWSITNVKTPYLSPTDRISPALIDCASPGLYFKVTTDSDISAALTTLFQKAVATAHLTR